MAFGFHRPCRSEGTKKPESLPESWEQSRARAKRGSKGGPGKSRGRRHGLKGLRRDFPQRIPRRRAGRILDPGQGRVFGNSRQRQARARPPLGLSLRDKTQGSKGEDARATPDPFPMREKKKALTDLGRSIRASESACERFNASRRANLLQAEEASRWQRR